MESLRTGRPEAAAANWNWREPGAGSDADESAESAGRARLLGSLQALGIAAVGVLLRIYWSQTVGAVVLTLAGVVLASALISPTGLYLGIRRGIGVLARLTGRGMTWILMVPIFYLIFLPFGLLFRRGRRDRLKRYFEADAPSYWEDHEGPTTSSSSYDRQY